MTAGSLIKVEKGSVSTAPIPLDKKDCPRTYICCNDERFNFVFTKKEDADENPVLPVVIEREKFDYGVIIKKGDKDNEEDVGTLDEVEIKNETKKYERKDKKKGKEPPIGLQILKGKHTIVFD